MAVSATDLPASGPTAAPADGGMSARMLDFLAYLEFERGLSRNTLEAYRSDLLQLGAFLGRRGVDAVDVQHADLSAFLSELATGGEGRPPVAAATLQRKAACLRSFYRHLRREGVLDRDPTADLRAPRKSQRLPQVLSRDEIARLLSAPKGTDPAALRDRALLELMYACGLRASEAIGLDVRDVDLTLGVLRARGKGSKERLVPIGREAVAATKVYVERGRPSFVGLGDEPHLFVNRRGGGLTRQGLYKIVQRHARAVGPRGPHEPAHAAPHLRHAPARRRLRSALAAGDARPRRHRHDADLHAPLRRAAEGRLLQGAPARDERLSENAAVSRRAFVVVLDACGVGALPDASEYAGDAGSNTLAHLAEDVGGLHLPVMGRLGLGSILPLEGVPPAAAPAIHGRLHPLGPGKESTTGHWELMGVVPTAPLPTYPNGFPPEVVAMLEERDRAALLRQPPGERDRGHRAVGRAPPEDRRGDPLHLGRLGAPARRAPRRAQRARPARRVRRRRARP